MKYKVIENGIEYDVEEHSNGANWYLNNEQHRENGPAIECVNGSKFWFKHDKLHRENGPAVILSDGTEEYWLNDIHYSNVTSPEELLLASIIT